MAEQAIVEFTEKVAREMAAAFAGDRLGELRAWIRIAHQREAMVTELYSMSHIDGRLAGLPAQGAAQVVRSVVASIWAHEESHTRHLSALRSLSSDVAGIAEAQGEIEGKIMRGLVSGGALARALIAVGASLGRVPDFVAELGRLDLRALLEFCGELETTARLGYARILQLLRDLEGDPQAMREFGYTLPFDVARILSEERFHEDTFAAMGRWVARDRESFIAIEALECAQTLHDLAERNLSVGVVRALVDPSAPQQKGDQPGLPWVSDGGLLGVFQRFELPVPLMTGDVGAPSTSAR